MDIVIENQAFIFALHFDIEYYVDCLVVIMRLLFSQKYNQKSVILTYVTNILVF